MRHSDLNKLTDLVGHLLRRAQDPVAPLPVQFLALARSDFVRQRLGAFVVPAQSEVAV